MTLFPWQQELWQRILIANAQQRLPHAWLVTGAKGVGKKQFALFLAAWLLCTEKTEQACNSCRSCKLWQSHQHPDYHYLSTENDSSLNTDAARELKIKLSDSAQQNGARVVLINTAEKLTTSAANALLKLIEEPPENVYFILITSRPILLPITLRSRCQNLYIAAPSSEQTSTWLKAQGDFSDVQINKALHLSFGSPLDALVMLSNPDLLTAQEEASNDFLATLNGKQSAITLAAKWSSLEAEDLFLAIEYVIRRLARQASGVNNQIPKKNISTHWFKIYELMQRSHQQLLQITGLNRQLFWERFLLECHALCPR